MWVKRPQKTTPKTETQRRYPIGDEGEMANHKRRCQWRPEAPRGTGIGAALSPCADEETFVVEFPSVVIIGLRRRASTELLLHRPETKQVNEEEVEVLHG